MPAPYCTPRPAYRFVYNAEMMRPMWHDYGGHAVRGLQRHGNKWSDAERRHLYAGYVYEVLSIAELANRHQRGVAGVVSQINHIMNDAQLTNTLIKHLHYNGELTVHNKTSPADDSANSLPEQKTSGQDMWSGPSPGNTAYTCNIPAPPEYRRLSALGATLAEAQTAHFRVQQPRGVPNADVIHAYADGKAVQHCSKSAGGRCTAGWADFTSKSSIALGTPLGWDGTKYEWRVKPERLTRSMHVSWDSRAGFMVAWNRPGKGNMSVNLELTFEDAELVSAKVV